MIEPRAKRNLYAGLVAESSGVTRRAALFQRAPAVVAEIAVAGLRQLAVEDAACDRRPQDLRRAVLT